MEQIESDVLTGELQSPEYLQRLFYAWDDLDLFIQAVMLPNNIPFHIQTQVDRFGGMQGWVVAYENVNRM